MNAAKSFVQKSGIQKSNCWYWLIIMFTYAHPINSFWMRSSWFPALKPLETGPLKLLEHRQILIWHQCKFPEKWLFEAKNDAQTWLNMIKPLGRQARSAITHHCSSHLEKFPGVWGQTATSAVAAVSASVPPGVRIGHHLKGSKQSKQDWE